MPVALCWAIAIVWSFYNEIPVSVYEYLLLFLLWCTVMGSSILVSWVLNDKPNLYESDGDDDDETLNTSIKEVPSARGEESVSLLEEAQNNGSTKFPERYRGGIACVFLLALGVTIVSYGCYSSKFEHINLFPIALLVVYMLILVVHMVLWCFVVGVSVLLYILSVQNQST